MHARRDSRSIASGESHPPYWTRWQGPLCMNEARHVPLTPRRAVSPNDYTLLLCAAHYRATRNTITSAWSSLSFGHGNVAFVWFFIRIARVRDDPRKARALPRASLIHSRYFSHLEAHIWDYRLRQQTKREKWPYRIDSIDSIQLNSSVVPSVCIRAWFTY